MTDWNPLVIALAAVLMAVAAGLPGLLAYLQGKASHRLMNSRLTELLKITRNEARAKGKIEGRTAERKRVAAEK